MVGRQCHVDTVAPFVQQEVAVRVFLVEVALIHEHALHLVAIELSDRLSYYRIGVRLQVDHARHTGCGRIKVGNLIPVERNGQSRTPHEVLRIDVHRVQRKLHAFVRHGAGVHPRRGNHAVHVRRQRSLHQQVVRILIISVHDELHAVVEQVDIQTHVPSLRFLPLQILVGIVARIEAGAPDGRRRRHGNAVGIAAGSLVTHQAPAETELQVIQPLHILQEGLVLHLPGQGCRGEVTPTVGRAEVGRTVRTQGEGS